MSRETSLADLLRWRLAQAAHDAPPAPRAADLLEAARPWWETWPERFRVSVERLGSMQLSYGYAMTDLLPGRAGYPVPTLIVNAEDLETAAKVLYLSVRDGRLRLRFELGAVPIEIKPVVEVTFVSDLDGRPIMSASATLSVESEYRLDAELPPEIAQAWQPLKVTDRMPFRFILRPITQVG